MNRHRFEGFAIELGERVAAWLIVETIDPRSINRRAEKATGVPA